MVAACLGACSGPDDKPEPLPIHSGPIVLITIDALRADVIGALGGPPKLTPHLDRLVAEATWAGRAISPSSWTVPAMASLFTGLQPWRTQSWSGDRAILREDLVTLPEALKAKGFRTAAFRTNHWLQQQYGYGQGFDDFRYLREGKRAEAHLEKLDGGAELVWIHILQPHAPYVRREPLLDHLSAIPARPAAESPPPGPGALLRSRRAAARRAAGDLPRASTSSTPPGPTSWSAAWSRHCARAASGTARCSSSPRTTARSSTSMGRSPTAATSAASSSRCR